MNGSRPPTQIGSIRLLDPLGEGGMALVFRGEDRFRSGTFCAVKLLRPEVHRDADLVRRFLREGDVLTRLSHPALVEIYSFGTSGVWPYLVMELLPGGSLKGCRGEAPAALARRLVPVCGALSVAHAAGVVHRDLKPSNLLFAADGSLKAGPAPRAARWWWGPSATWPRSSMAIRGGWMAAATSTPWAPSSSNS